MEHLKMLRLLSYLLGLFIFPSVQGGLESNSKDQSLCVLQDAPQQCGSFCLAALNPLFDDSDSMRMTLDEIKAEQTALKDFFRMTTLQGQEDLQAGLDSRFKLAEEQHMTVNSEMKNQLQELKNKVEGQHTGLQESVSKIITKADFANSMKVLQTKLDVGLNRMEELRTMKTTADDNDKLKIQVNTLQVTIKDLQSKLKISEGQTKSKENILRVKEEHLKNRDKQISDFRIQINAINKTKSELSGQLSKLHKIDDKLKISEARIKINESILKVKEEQIKSQQKDLTNRDEQISDLRTQINAINKTKSELSSQLSELRKIDVKFRISEGLIKIKEDILKVKEEQIKSQQNYLTNRDEQISDLWTQIKTIEKRKSDLFSQLSECQIKLREMEPFKVSCASSPPGWTVIQRRIDGSENFNRNWNAYKRGFGNVKGEFFIGLEKLHRMTEARPHELYIKLGSVNGSTSYAQYDDFMIGSEEELYELKNLGEYSGEAGDSLTNNKNQKFSTFDRDNDNTSGASCASSFGAWWHNDCSESMLNGKYLKDGKGWNGIIWYLWHDDWDESLTFVEMMIRPKVFYLVNPTV